VGSTTNIDELYLVSIKAGAASISKNKKVRAWKRGREGIASI
jgi:hypothetical protein